LQTRVERIGSRVGDASDADAAVARAQEHYALDEVDWIRVDASGSIEHTLDNALKAIGLARG